MGKIMGISYKQLDGNHLFHIKDFSYEVKEALRDELAKICHGELKANKRRDSYKYKETLKEFLIRYKAKKDLNKRIGMLGELLAHLIIIKYFDSFDTVSPYFNLEERGVKKGFDVILFTKHDDKIWITEVKSGKLHKGRDSSETTHELIGTANRDLRKRLNQNEVSLWQNAINGALVAVDGSKDFKSVIEELLEDMSDEATNNNAKSRDKNVVLVSVLFADLKDEISIDEVCKSAKKLKNDFSNQLVISIQKSTLEKIESFLVSEAN